MIKGFLWFLGSLGAMTGSIAYDIPEKYQGNATIRVIWTDYDTISLYCGKPSAPKYHVLGCVMPNDVRKTHGEMVMVLPNACDSKNFPETLNPSSYAHLV